ncbi:MAG: CHASE domain-containing protein, partial [Parcubacteria group bacterium]|nr:CHASE domain-containing protein [Parcubacteria group bacterium]
MKQKIKKTKLILPILIFIFSLALAIYAWKETKNFVEYQRQEQFNNAAKEIVIRTEDKLSEYVNILFGARALFSASTEVNRNEWNAYINSLPINERFPGMQALSFITRVLLEDKENFTEEVRNDTSLISEGYPNFIIYPEGDREEYYIVTYIEPFEGNEAAFGFDLFSNSSRRAGLEEAMDTNKPVATAPIRLVQEEGEQMGFLVFLPVYKNNVLIETVEEKREALIGYISAVFRAGDLLSALLRNIDIAEGLNIDIFDSTDDLGEKSKLVSHNHGESSYQSMFVQDSDLDIAGRRWSLHFEDSSEFFPSSAEKLLPFTVLIAGLIFSVLVFFVLYSFSRTKLKATQLARKLTVDLQKFQLAVENASDHIIITDLEGSILYANKAAERITGYLKKEMLGKKSGDLWGGKMDRAFYQKMWKTIKQEKKVFVGELTNKRKSGEKYEVQLRISPVL